VVEKGRMPCVHSIPPVPVRHHGDRAHRSAKTNCPRPGSRHGGEFTGVRPWVQVRYARPGMLSFWVMNALLPRDLLRTADSVLDRAGFQRGPTACEIFRVSPDAKAVLSDAAPSFVSGSPAICLGFRRSLPSTPEGDRASGAFLLPPAARSQVRIGPLNRAISRSTMR